MTHGRKMDAEDVKKKLKTGECLLVAQEGKGKADLRRTFDLVVETTRDSDKGGYRSKWYVSIMSAKQSFSDHIEQCKQQ